MYIMSKCEKGLSLEECELTILRMAVDKAEQNVKKKKVNSPIIKNIISIVEKFIKKNQMIVYGGTAINSILPVEDQFYNKEIELPDYDFFSIDAFNDAKKLANDYYKEGFSEVEAKSGIHTGTYKVFVNFIPIADITQLNGIIFKSIKKDSIIKEGIYYTPPNFLRMSLFLELSRPDGDTSRWEKLLKRITLLNKNYPLQSKNCNKIDFQRKTENTKNVENIYTTIKNTFIDEGVVFFGGYAISLYSDYMPSNLKQKFQKFPDFDVLSIHPEKTAENIKNKLHKFGNIRIVKHKSIGEVISEHYEIIVNKDTVAFIYKPLACHSYNIIKSNKKSVKIATIDTMLSFYLAFLYANQPYYDVERILCMSQYLFTVQQQNRLEQKGLLRRFSVLCYGHQETLEEIRAEKSRKYMELKNKKGTKEYEMVFMRYRPQDQQHKYQKTYKRSKYNNYTKKRRRYY